MDPVCHHCGTTLNSSEMFCPHCGAPQLRFEATEEQTRYQPGASANGLHAGQLISWRPAIQAVLIVVVPVSLLSALLDFSILWVLAGGFAAVALYQRKAAGSLQVRAGWRIGLLFGVLTAFLSSIVNGLSMLFERYGLHQGASIDQKLAGLAQQMTEQMARENPEAAQQIPWFLHFWLSPDGHAAIVIFMAAFAAVVMVAFSTIGGAVGARILGTRRRLSTNS